MKPVSPYKARFRRRWIHFWWQAVAVLFLTGFLFLQIPFKTIAWHAQALPMPLPAPTAAYVTLDPDYAAQLFRRSLATWMTGQSGKQNAHGLDLGALDFDNGLGAPAFLEKSGFPPSDWPPIAIAPLPVTFAEIAIPTAASPAQTAPQKPKEGLFIETSPELSAAGFTFPSDELKSMPERTGECRFFVETGADGNVAHVILRSTPSPSTPPLERALSKGRARTAANGDVSIRWRFEK